MVLIGKALSIYLKLESQKGMELDGQWVLMILED